MIRGNHETREVNGNIYVNVAEVLPADPDDTPF